jgi:exodeoxyribonuclease V beta subunit
MSTSIRPIWWQLPLSGTSLIEASAGTGKTWNIALLYLRLLLERKLGARQILVTTFTDAAAQELRARIRARLLDAERIVDANTFAGADLDDFLAERCAADGNGVVLARLRLALADIDMAPISTIHGFCRRVLADYPFDTGMPFALGEIVDENTLIRECVEDFWRARFLGGDVDPIELELVTEGTVSVGKLSEITAFAQSSPEARIEIATEQDLGVPQWLRRPETIDAIRAIALDKSRFRPRVSALAPRLRSFADYLSQLPAQGDCEAFEDLAGLLKYVTGKDLAGQEHPDSPGALTQDPLLGQIRHWARLQQREAIVRSGQMAVKAIERTRTVLPERLRLGSQTTFSQLISEVHDRLTGPNGAVLAARLRKAWPVALIDEFQDTDARQWAIFDRIYQHPDEPGDTALVLIGDPKQSIYAFRGADIHAYLAARQKLPAERQYSIRHNFRSHPQLLGALNDLYGLAEDVGFASSEIRYVAVSSGQPEKFAAKDQAPLRLRLLQCEKKGVTERDPVALTACANDIVALLMDAGSGVKPGDITVLIDSNKRIQWMRELLIERGVPVVGAGRASVLATEWASDLQLLLHALLQPNDEYAVRGALATRLLGATARDLTELAANTRAWEGKLDQFANWRRLWDRRGFLAVIEAVVLEQAPRLLAGADGERALTDLRHLGEVLQDAAADCYGPEELYAWFLAERDGARAESVEAGREQQLRIESEARRVQLLTIHASKGLEYPVVFIPTAWRTRNDHPRDVRKNLARYHDAEHCLSLDFGTADFDANKAAERFEGLQERLRVLYVAMTRAESQCIAYAFEDTAARAGMAGIVDQSDRGALETLLSAALHAAGAGADAADSGWDALSKAIPGLRIDLAETSLQHYRGDATDSLERVARAPLPSARPYHGLYSFTALMRIGVVAAVDAPQWAEDESMVTDGGVTPITSEEEPDVRISVLARVKGPRFGDAMHQLLEQGRAVDAIPAALRGSYVLQTDRIAAALDTESVKLEQGRKAEQLTAIADLLDRTLDSQLAPGLRLTDLASTACRPEFEFAFVVDEAHWHRMHGLLEAHGLGDWWPASAEKRVLRGMMKGFMDLVFAWDGRYHVLDYKTNWLGEGRLSDYAPERLETAMQEHHYGLQALIYTVALHRYLAHRLIDYDPAVHLGDSWYLFIRAVGLGSAAGIWRKRFPQTLIDQLDALFEGQEVYA